MNATSMASLPKDVKQFENDTVNQSLYFQWPL